MMGDLQLGSSTTLPCPVCLLLAALVQELLHNKTQSASSRTRMLLMIRSSAVCLLNTISTAISSSSTSDGMSGQINGLDSPGSKRVHKVCVCGCQGGEMNGIGVVCMAWGGWV